MKLTSWMLATVAVVSVGAGANGADLLVQDGVPVQAASPLSGYIRVMGGMTIPNTLHYTGELGYGEGDFDLLAGRTFGATAGINTSVEGLSVETDLLRSVVQYDSDQYAEPYEDYLNSTSVMGNIVYNVDVNEQFAVYGGVGAGVIWVDYDAPADPEYNTSGSGLGFQVFGGIQTAVTENIALTLEARYQSAIEEVEMEQGDSFELNRAAILGGVLFSF